MYYGPRILAAITAGQVQGAADGARYVPAVLAELGIAAPAAGSVQPYTFAGVASSGYSLTDVLASLVIDAKSRIAQGLRATDALAASRPLLDGITLTQIADASRVAAGVGIASRPKVQGYVRMLNPPSCSRCVVLAGKFFRWNSGFERHPRCDCRHIPSSEDAADDLRTDPRDYFDSLTETEQDAVFTPAGAKAIRDGADISQVVNTRRRASGISAAGTTTEATTRRGVAGARLKGRVRLMPEAIYRIAHTRQEAITLLKQHGYLL